MKAEKILHRCDANEDGAIGKREFQDYYEQVAGAMNKFHRAKAAKAKKEKQEKGRRQQRSRSPNLIDKAALVAEVADWDTIQLDLGV